MTRAPVYLNQLGIVCAMGDSPASIRERMLAGAGDCLTYTDTFSPGHQLPLGCVNTVLPSLQDCPREEQTRTNQLLAAAMQQLRSAFEEARAGLDPLRIGIVLGTSTGGIAEGEAAIAAREEQGTLPADFHYRQQEMAGPAEALARWLNVDGPALVISTACSSSAKALASARRLLRLGVCDLVIAGGVDSLCSLTVQGFMALSAVSDKPCQPFSVERDGINIGEAAALFLVSKEPGPVALCGVGECSDAHHISAPEPDGKGAAAAMALALTDAGLAPTAIDYLNLHGTATAQNDRMESLAVARILGTDVPCSSTKPYTGHTLGAAGAVEAAICWLTLCEPAAGLPLHLWDANRDPELAPLTLVEHGRKNAQAKYAMSNSFAFGGNNISLILERSE